MKRLLPTIVFSLVPLVALAEEPSVWRINFARDIQPILADKCFACHGPDEKTREAGLRIDDRAAATKAVESGTVAIVPGKPLAERALVEGGQTDEQRLTFVFRLATGRLPTEPELEVMQSVLQEQSELYKDNTDKAKQLLSNGDRSWNSELDPCELAAWTMLSSMILNLDETVTKS